MVQDTGLGLVVIGRIRPFYHENEKGLFYRFCKERGKSRFVWVDERIRTADLLFHREAL